MSLTVKHIFIHPVKSMAGQMVEEAALTADGLAGDRQFVVATGKGKCLTARECPSLVLINAVVEGDSLLLSTTSGDTLRISLFKPFTEQHVIRVWDDDVTGLDMGDEVSRWLSGYLGRDCRMLSMVKSSVRQGKFRGTPNGFADATPLLLTCEASLIDLNARLERPVTQRNFRPNIVVEGPMEPFGEDLWSEFKIGDIAVKDTWGCSRCILTTVDPDTGIKSNDMEPITTLKTFRPAPDKRIYFGQNIIPQNEGIIHVGDRVEITARRTRPYYMADGLL